MGCRPSGSGPLFTSPEAGVRQINRGWGSRIILFRYSYRVFPFACVQIGTRVNATGFLHERLQSCPWRLPTSDVPQRPRPLADRFAVGVLSGAANDDRKWVGIFVEGQPRKLERVSQELLSLSSHFVMHDCLEDSA